MAKTAIESKTVRPLVFSLEWSKTRVGQQGQPRSRNPLRLLSIPDELRPRQGAVVDTCLEEDAGDRPFPVSALGRRTDTPARRSLIKLLRKHSLGRNRIKIPFK
jgi:hypothetical protein